MAPTAKVAGPILDIHDVKQREVMASNGRGGRSGRFFRRGKRSPSRATKHAAISEIAAVMVSRAALELAERHAQQQLPQTSFT
jgi:hypothetical protein